MQTGDPRLELTSIVAIDKNGAIGCKNALPWKLQDDLSFFKKTTTSHSIIMGRKTYDSIGRCLPKRRNIVLSRNDVLFAPTDQCRLVGSVAESLYHSGTNKRLKRFVIGGAQTYSLFADLVDRYIVTVVQHEVEEADAFLSADILKSFASWDRNEVATFEAAEGHNDFACHVYEFFAPNPEERADRREALVRDFTERAFSKSQNYRSSSDELDPTAQSSFAFG
jgi:dihydrofolate reductase